MSDTELKNILTSIFICSFVGHNEVNITPYCGYEYGDGFNLIECKRCKAERWA